MRIEWHRPKNDPSAYEALALARLAEAEAKAAGDDDMAGHFATKISEARAKVAAAVAEKAK